MHDMEFLRDPAVSAVLAALALVVAWLVYRGRKRKELRYEVLSATRVLTQREELANRVRILFGERDVRDVSLVLVQLFNTGNDPIVPADFSQQLTLWLSGGTILSAEVIETWPPNVDTVVEVVDNRARLVPRLINGDDIITIRLIITEYQAPVKVDARIVGVSRVREIGPRTFESTAATVLSFLAISEGGMIGLLIATLILSNFELPPDISKALALLGLTLGAVPAVFLWKRFAYGARINSSIYRKTIADRAQSSSQRSKNS